MVSEGINLRVPVETVECSLQNKRLGVFMDSLTLDCRVQQKLVHHSPGCAVADGHGRVQDKPSAQSRRALGSAGKCPVTALFSGPGVDSNPYFGRSGNFDRFQLPRQRDGGRKFEQRPQAGSALTPANRSVR
jgi:hypothetical protein